MKSLLFITLVVLVSVSLQHKLDRGQWLHQNRAKSNELTNITLALNLRNAGELQTIFEEVSSPKHPNWRKFLTREQVISKFYPTKDSVSQVVSYLYENGALAVDSSLREIVIATFTVDQVEKLLSVKLHEYKSVDGKQKILRSPTMYEIPKELENLVAVLGQVSEFPALHLSSHTRMDRREELNKLAKLEKIAHEKTFFHDVSDSASVCNAVPNYGYPETSDTDLYSQVQIVCCGGNLTTDVITPCSDFPPVLTGFSVYSSNNFTGAKTQTTTIPYSSLQCYSDGVGVTCNVPWTLNQVVEPYQQYNLFVTELFGTGNISYTAQFPTALVTSAFVTPQLFAQYYDIPLNYKGVAPNNIQSVVEFGGQYYSPSDLSNFFGNMSLVGAPVTVVGPNDPSVPGDEATLDIEWIMAVGRGIPTTFWSIGHGYLIEWTAQLLNATNPPLVNSVSYAGNEDDSPKKYRDYVDTQFQLLGVRGVSVVVASGDAGATDVGHGYDACTPLQPQYPSSSPYVTTVSATYFSPSSDPICNIHYYGKKVHCSDLQMGEVVVAANNGMDWTTGGGFSNHVPRPSYQEAAVAAYLNNYPSLLPPSSYFNQSNRAYPDVSATGHNLLLILNDAMDIGDGTSAATPIFAAFLSLLNDYLLMRDQAPIGFANPLLYEIQAAYPAAFYDVTLGDNKCGDVLHPPYIACCEYGYVASNGWDPVTGLGTPRFAALLNAVFHYTNGTTSF